MFDISCIRLLEDDLHEISSQILFLKKQQFLKMSFSASLP